MSKYSSPTLSHYKATENMIIVSNIFFSHFITKSTTTDEDIEIMKRKLTLRSSDDRKPPIHIKHRSAGVFHIPDNIWKTSAFAAIPFSLKMSSKCAVTLSTIVRSSVSPACELTAALSSFICLLYSSSHRAYSASNAKAPIETRNQEDKF